jgi:hypothetical protein
MTCQELDGLVTRFIDGECSAAHRTVIIAHLGQCHGCRTRVDAESTAKQVLRAYATVARTMGVPPPWRPRVFRLGQPTWPVPPTVLLLSAAIGVGALGFWQFSTPVAPVIAVGVIGDSFCERDHEHGFMTRPGRERECTLNCVKGGADFVLVTDSQVYRIRNQEFPELATFANVRVSVTGDMSGDTLIVSRLAAVADR